MFRIKICGLTRLADACCAAEAGADALGFNFYTGSRRCVEPETARRIVDALPPGVARVGVFVNHSAAEIAALVAQVRLDTIQLHGDEPASLAADLPELPVIRAVRCRGPEEIAQIVAWTRDFLAAGGRLAGLLADAYHPTAYGGTGQRTDAQVWQALRRHFPQLPLVLAGGLRADNVGTAIQELRPDGVDTASGVESAAGIKDHTLVRQFVAAARAAWAPPTPGSGS